MREWDAGQAVLVSGTWCQENRASGEPAYDRTLGIKKSC